MNKYKILTILIVSLLAIGGYIFTNIYSDSGNTISKEKKLVVTGACKPIENQCEILGNEIKMTLSFKAPPSYQRLLPITLSSETSLDDVSLSLIINDDEMAPIKMKNTGDKKTWMANVMPNATVSNKNLKIRLTVSYKATLHSAKFPIEY